MVFSAQPRTHLGPEHNTSRLLTAGIGPVADISYNPLADVIKFGLEIVEYLVG